eukprot:10259953-Lingulodinium_polyedra.AAC.1
MDANCELVVEWEGRVGPRRTGTIVNERQLHLLQFAQDFHLSFANTLETHGADMSPESWTHKGASGNLRQIDFWLTTHSCNPTARVIFEGNATSSDHRPLHLLVPPPPDAPSRTRPGA